MTGFVDSGGGFKKWKDKNVPLQNVGVSSAPGINDPYDRGTFILAGNPQAFRNKAFSFMQYISQ